MGQKILTGGDGTTPSPARPAMAPVKAEVATIGGGGPSQRSFESAGSLVSSALTAGGTKHGLTLPVPQSQVALEDKYQLDSADTLGEGTHGEVFGGKRLIDGARVAIKLVPFTPPPMPVLHPIGHPHTSQAQPPADVGGMALHKAMEEVRAMRECAGPHVIQVVDVFEDHKASLMAVVLERADRDLYDLVSKEGPLSEAHAKHLMRELLIGLSEIHRAGWAHRDIKLENLLLVGDSLKICDFGLAGRCVSHGQHIMMTLPCGTPQYVAPEVVKHHHRAYDGCLVDAWSAGVVLFVLVAGSFPWSEPTLKDNRFKTLAQGAYQYPGHFTGELRGFLSVIFQSANRRHKVAQLIDHAWIKDGVDVSDQTDSASAVTTSATSISKKLAALPLGRTDTKPLEDERPTTPETPHKRKLQSRSRSCNVLGDPIKLLRCRTNGDRSPRDNDGEELQPQQGAHEGYVQ